MGQSLRIFPSGIYVNGRRKLGNWRPMNRRYCQEDYIYCSNKFWCHISNHVSITEQIIIMLCIHSKHKQYFSFPAQPHFTILKARVLWVKCLLIYVLLNKFWVKYLLFSWYFMQFKCRMEWWILSVSSWWKSNENNQNSDKTDHY